MLQFTVVAAAAVLIVAFTKRSRFEPSPPEGLCTVGGIGGVVR
jgi:hypothetical protein